MPPDDEFLTNLMLGAMGDLDDQMTYEQAAMDAIADHRTEQQAERMGIN